MRYSPPSKQLYIKNRTRLVEKLAPKSVAVFNSNDIMPTNADGVMPFRQNNDLLYFTGIDQEDTILLVMPDYPAKSQQEILFLKETNDLIAVWEGHKFTKEEARELSGIDTIYWVSEFKQVLNALMVEVNQVYLNSNEHTRATLDVETKDARFSKWCHQKYPNHSYKRSAPIMHELRSVKDQEEIDMLQEACDITEAGFRRILKFVKPGVNEFEIEAEYLHEFVRNKSKGFAYQPIIASGLDSCVLHYVENKKACKDGDVLLMDVAAEYGNYNADMTRTIPVNGRFTDRQRAVYDAVLRVKNEATNMLRPGTIINDYNKEVGLVMEKELLSLGLIDQTDIKNQDPANPAYRKYFMHGTSHFLGLDVHDVGNFYTPITEGMVFTVEPGIYISKENFGVRLEDDVVIQKDGVLNLMKNIPLEADEIETLMNELICL
ncbi:MAG: aminopeptidase P N-terminal domain-containing protein [Cyclobacteriaceae bacterium]|nr:aminopeptidase P N-terminal domain-containing protein [Cyclobacteriaceae bacterium]